MFANFNLMPNISKSHRFKVEKNKVTMEDQTRAFSSPFRTDPPYNDPE